MDNLCSIFKVSKYRTIETMGNLIYSVVDSRLSEYARYELESGALRIGKFRLNRDWGK